MHYHFPLVVIFYFGYLVVDALSYHFTFTFFWFLHLFFSGIGWYNDFR